MNRVFHNIPQLCETQQQPASTPSPLADKAKQFGSNRGSADVSKLSYGDRQALRQDIRSGKTYGFTLAESRNEEDGSVGPASAKLRADNTPAGKEKLNYFRINMRLMVGAGSSFTVHGRHLPEHPAGANYYPANMTKDEFMKWDSTLFGRQEKGSGRIFLPIRGDENGKLMTVPYSTEYKTYLEPAAKLLHEAAALTDNKTLKDFLNKRADAFLSNDYYESDIAWMDLDGPIEPTIGPYEVYMDELFNYKRDEAFITIRDDEETGKLAKFASYLQEIENNLPIEKKYAVRN